MEELESSQAIQWELHVSLDSALDRLNQLYEEMQEVRRSLDCLIDRMEMKARQGKAKLAYPLPNLTEIGLPAGVRRAAGRNAKLRYETAQLD